LRRPNRRADRDLPRPEPRGCRELAGHLAAYASAGVTEVHLMPWSGDPVGFVEGLGQHVVPRLTELG
jgi:hypothetical protein